MVGVIGPCRGVPSDRKLRGKWGTKIESCVDEDAGR